MTEPENLADACVVCLRRRPDRPAVCEADRARLAARLRELPELFAELTAPPETLTDDRVRLDKKRRLTTQLRDPVAGRLPAAPVRGAPPGGRVSGTAEPSTPLQLGRADLAAPAVRLGGVPVECTRDTLVPKVVTWTTVVRVMQVVDGVEGERRVTVWHRAPLLDATGAPIMCPAGDQHGHMPVAAVLDSWVRYWIENRGQREHRPAVDVATLCGWLLDRLDWACDEHPAVAEFAEELGALRTALRGACGLIEYDDDYKDGVPCRTCDELALYQANGSDRIECGNCPALMTEDEYHRWVGMESAVQCGVVRGGRGCALGRDHEGGCLDQHGQPLDDTPSPERPELPT